MPRVSRNDHTDTNTYLFTNSKTLSHLPSLDWGTAARAITWNSWFLTTVAMYSGSTPMKRLVVWDSQKSLTTYPTTPPACPQPLFQAPDLSVFFSAARTYDMFPIPRTQPPQCRAHGRNQYGVKVAVSVLFLVRASTIPNI